LFLIPNPLRIFKQNLLTGATQSFVVRLSAWPGMGYAASRVPSFSRKFVMAVVGWGTPELEVIRQRLDEAGVDISHYHPIGHKNSSCALGLEPIYGRLFAESV
jgi:hypothetical protein